MPSVHATLSASGAKRWMTCPKSVKLESYFEDQDTEFSIEGTAAHSLAEKMLSIYKATGKREWTNQEVIDQLDVSKYDMISAVLKYLDFVSTEFEKAKLIHQDAELLIEQRVDFGNYVKDGFGTSDCIILYGNNLHIIDYKHGMGVKVNSNENPQMRLYALGAYNELNWEYDIKEVEMTIVQPRIGWIDSEKMELESLLKWGKQVVIPAAKKAYHDQGDFQPTEEACRFCKARAVCKARAKKYLGKLLAIVERK